MVKTRIISSPGQVDAVYVAARQAARALVEVLLNETSVPLGALSEATVHRSRGSRIWVANFTGPAGGQVWKSTGSTDRHQALEIARRWEAEARDARLRTRRGPGIPVVRIRRSQAEISTPGLTQREVAMILNMSERGVREIERRAFRKLRAHPALRQVWQQFLAGKLGESAVQLSAEEIRAIFRLARTSEERQLLRKILRLVRH